MKISVAPERIYGDMIVRASQSPDPDGGGFQVNITFDNRGTKKFGEITKANIGRQFAACLKTVECWCHVNSFGPPAQTRV